MAKQTASLGDFVSAKSVANYSEDERDLPTFDTQGVVTKDNTDGTMMVLRETGQLVKCYGPENIAIVPDRNLRPDTLEWVQHVRQDL